ncbi:nucleotidyltransferase domain-containing protein [Candidatus Pacearchaeota archaeon]|nr:nucleotidyltransferase domain-containing protein [Candidatus Pacearchaeota archaeon]
MNTKKTNSILKEVLSEAKPNKNEIKEIANRFKDFKVKLLEKIKKLKVHVEIFVGGSFAKKTLIRKKEYDVDVFLRFDKRHRKEISELTEKILNGFNKTKIHGSRDYFMIKLGKNIIFEVIPVLKIKNPKEAENITDLSYFHVNYVRKKVNPKVIDEIIIAKTFCHANGFYGAESYIKGFSGYGLELLIHHYGSFLKFIKTIAKTEDKLIIDTEKHFKNKQEIMMDLNTAKLASPIVLIDPTFKQRNALAALSYETFKEFRKKCKNFLKNPGKHFFEKKEIDFDKIRKNALKGKNEFLNIKTKTEKQEGDIAGSKLLKFYNFLEKEISKFFQIRNKGFVYEGGKTAKYFFVVKKKKEIVFHGPMLTDKKNVERFRKKHKKTFNKGKRIYAEEKFNLTLKKFLQNWKIHNKKRMQEMSVEIFDII